MAGTKTKKAEDKVETVHFSEKIKGAKAYLEDILNSSLSPGLVEKGDLPKIREGMLNFAREWEAALAVFSIAGLDAKTLAERVRVSGEVGGEMRMLKPWDDRMYVALKPALRNKMVQFHLHDYCVAWGMILHATLTDVPGFGKEALYAVEKDPKYSRERALKGVQCW